jgi:hypothetical protein
MGMRVAVLDHGAYRAVTTIGDSGPIAFHELAVLVPVVPNGRDDSLHVRLSFVADSWRIDQVRLALEHRRPTTRRVAPTGAVTNASVQRADVLRDLKDADERYVVTGPGQSFTVRFAVGLGTAGPSRTYLLGAQGYYTEWVRGGWLKAATGRKFTPSDDVLFAAVANWRRRRDTFERAFYSTRIAVR